MKTTHRVVVVGTVALLSLPLSKLVYSCFGGQYDSVHFNSAMPDFAAPPPALEIAGWREEKSGRNSDYYAGDWRDAQAYEREQKELDLLISKALSEEKGRRFPKAISLYKRIGEMPEANRGFCVDRVEVLTRASQANPKLLQTYLNATAATELPDEVATETTAKSRKQLTAIYANKKAGYLRAHALYALAASDRSLDAMHDSRAYERVAREFPQSPRTESALIMAARRLLEEKDRWHRDKFDRALVARCRALLSELLTRYPQTRFRTNAIGWAGRVEYVMGRYASAERLYMRQLSAGVKGEEKFKAYQSIAVCRQAMNDKVGALIAWLSYAKGTSERYDYAWSFVEISNLTETLSKEDARLFTKRLVDRPELIGPYLDYRLYLRDITPTETKALLVFADQAIKKHENAPVAAQICARVAELQYLNGKPERAMAWAKRAWSKGQKLSDRADLALYIQGAVARRTGDYAAAASSLSKLVRLFPKSYLVGGARENLALVHEATGRLDLALDQYFELRYEADIAYLLDTRMSATEVGRYAASSRPSLSKPYDVFMSYEPTPVRYTFGEVVRYSLGTRLLRDMKLDEARAVFQAFPEHRLQALALPGKDEWWDRDPANKLRNPLNTIHNLKHRQQVIAKASTDEQRAEATYALGAYFYNNRDLLLYNRPLWDGMRMFSFDYYYNKDIAKPADTRAVRSYQYDHECLNQARLLFVEVAKKWPRSKAAPKALYSGACATGRLADMNQWWRSEDERANLSQKSIDLMKKLAKDYPTHALAKHAAKYAREWSTKPNW